MDWQQVFYFLGSIILSLTLVVFVAIAVLTIVFYYRYKKWVRESKEKVAKFKGKIAALPFLPIIGYFIKRLRKKRRRVEDES